MHGYINIKFFFSLISPTKSPIIFCNLKMHVVTPALLIRVKRDAKSLRENRLSNFPGVCLQTRPMR